MPTRTIFKLHYITLLIITLSDPHLFFVFVFWHSIWHLISHPISHTYNMLSVGSDTLSDILSDIDSDTLSTMYISHILTTLTFYLTYILAFHLTDFLAFCIFWLIYIYIYAFWHFIWLHLFKTPEVNRGSQLRPSSIQSTNMGGFSSNLWLPSRLAFKRGSQVANVQWIPRPACDHRATSWGCGIHGRDKNPQITMKLPDWDWWNWGMLQHVAISKHEPHIAWHSHLSHLMFQPTGQQQISQLTSSIG